MKKTTEENNEALQPDLKHDSMDYSAPTDGADELDVPDEEEEITADELNALEDDSTDNEDYALESAETDSEIDEDNFLTDTDEADEFDEDKNDNLNI